MVVSRSTGRCDTTVAGVGLGDSRLGSTTGAEDDGCAGRGRVAAAFFCPAPPVRDGNASVPAVRSAATDVTAASTTSLRPGRRRASVFLSGMSEGGRRELVKTDV